MSEQCWVCLSPLLSDGFCALCPRPIETAPKDKTRILLFSESRWVIGNRWDDKWLDDEQEYFIFEPSHWLPVPPNP